MTFPPRTKATALLFFFFPLQGNLKFNSGRPVCFSKITTARKTGCGRRGVCVCVCACLLPVLMYLDGNENKLEDAPEHLAR